jgi:hypothetical protein
MRMMQMEPRKRRQRIMNMELQQARRDAALFSRQIVLPDIFFAERRHAAWHAICC